MHNTKQLCKAMTKAELRKHLKAGKTLADLLVLSPGQGNEIFKADKFSLGNDIIYIPDLSVYDLSFAYKQHLDHLAATGIDISEYRLSVRLD